MTRVRLPVTVVPISGGHAIVIDPGQLARQQPDPKPPPEPKPK